MYDMEVVTMEKLEIVVPHNLEIVWGLARLKKGNIRLIIIATFYYPPKCRKKQKLINHIVTTAHLLLTDYPNAEIVIAGDRNDIDIAPICNKIGNLRLVPSAPTHRDKQLDDQ